MPPAKKRTRGNTRVVLVEQTAASNQTSLVDGLSHLYSIPETTQSMSRDAETSQVPPTATRRASRRRRQGSSSIQEAPVTSFIASACSVSDNSYGDSTSVNTLPIFSSAIDTSSTIFRSSHYVLPATQTIQTLHVPMHTTLLDSAGHQSINRQNVNAQVFNVTIPNSPQANVVDIQHLVRTTSCVEPLNTYTYQPIRTVHTRSIDAHDFFREPIMASTRDALHVPCDPAATVTRQGHQVNSTPFEHLHSVCDRSPILPASMASNIAVSSLNRQPIYSVASVCPSVPSTQEHYRPSMNSSRQTLIDQLQTTLTQLRQEEAVQFVGPTSGQNTGSRVQREGTMGRCRPNSDTAEPTHRALTSTVEHIMSRALSQTTQDCYAKSWTRLSEFCHLYGLDDKPPFPLSTLSLFIGHLYHRDYNISSVRTILAGIKYFLKLRGFPDPTDCFYIKKLLNGYNNLRPALDTRMPITELLLEKLLSAAQFCSSSTYFTYLYRAMFATAFYAFARVGELCPTSSRNTQHILQYSDIRTAGEDLVLTFRHYKHSTPGAVHLISLQRKTNTASCPVTLLLQYLQVRGSAPGPMFALCDGSPVLRRVFDRFLQSTLSFCGLDTNVYKSHSFRIGAATLAATKGFSDMQIRLMGRWKSDAFRRYVRPPPL